jgi:hypothetical protein
VLKCVLMCAMGQGEVQMRDGKQMLEVGASDLTSVSYPTESRCLPLACDAEQWPACESVHAERMWGLRIVRTWR